MTCGAVACGWNVFLPLMPKGVEQQTVNVVIFRQLAPLVAPFARAWTETSSYRYSGQGMTVAVKTLPSIFNNRNR